MSGIGLKRRFPCYPFVGILLLTSARHDPGPASGRDRTRSPTPHSPTRPDASPRQITAKAGLLGPKEATSSSAGSTYSSYKTAEERAAFIKQQAEQRMAERLAALGIRPAAKGGESAQQRLDRETKEREDRLRQAEAEDAKREEERQRRLADEQIQPAPATKTGGKKPPPPPSRKATRNDNIERANAKKQFEDEAARAELERKEQNLRAQQEAQEAERRAME